MRTIGRALRSLTVAILAWTIFLTALVFAFLFGAEVLPRLPYWQQHPPATATPLPADESFIQPAGTPSPFIHP